MADAIPTLIAAVSDVVLSPYRNEDGERVELLAHYVRAEFADGSRVAHERSFDTEAEAEALVARIEAAGRRINLDHWRSMPPMYGSVAYQNGGGLAEMQWEADLDRAEANGMTDQYHAVGGWR